MRKPDHSGLTETCFAGQRTHLCDVNQTGLEIATQRFHLLTIAPADPLNETEMEPAALSTTYYLAACSEANAGMKNRTPGHANPICGAPVSSMFSRDSPIVDLAARVQFLTGETVCGVVLLVTSSRDGVLAHGGFK
jgi:hypothetical protein